jgi:VWFA-related protein
MERRIRIAAGAVLSLSLVALAATAQEESPASVFLDTTEVNVINVDVVVTDREGWPVTGLRADDFVLFADGEPVPISNFFAIEDGRPVSFELPDPARAGEVLDAPPVAPVHLLLYIDSANLQPLNRKQALDPLREFLRANWSDELQVSLVGNERGLVIHQGFTNNQRRLFAALDRLETSTAQTEPFTIEERSLLRQIAAIDLTSPLVVRTPGPGGGATEPQNEGAPEQTFSIQSTSTDRMAEEALALVPQMRAYATSRHHHLQASLNVLRHFVDSAAGIPGRKAAIHISDGLELRPGAPVFEAFDRRFRNLPRVAGRHSALLEASAFDVTREYRDLVAHANAARVTLYTMDASLPNHLGWHNAESDARPSTDRRDWGPRGSAEDANQQDSLRLLAEGTGGQFAASPAGWGGVLEASLADFQHYYSLGYQVPPGSPSRDEPRQFEVRTANKDLRRRYRRSAVDKTADQMMSDRTLSGLLLEARDNPLDVELHTELAEDNGDGTFTLPVSVQMPLANLVLLPAAEVHQAQVALFVSVLDEKRRTSDVSKNLCPIRIRNEQLPTSMARPIRCGMRLRMRPGPQRVAIGVRDELAAVDSVVSVEVDVGAATDGG